MPSSWRTGASSYASSDRVSQAAEQTHRALGLTDGEYSEIGVRLGRTPNDFELAVFSLLWSEHCGYKHSRLELGRFPTGGARVVAGPGENAGVIDVGDGLGVAFKVESHNHPSAVEPVQGAATGVGGILRDIFAMGARPIAVLDSLRLGPLDEERPRELFRGIVRGIGSYGNPVGVANIGGETVFDAAYRENPLVNAMAIGVLPLDRLVRARAAGAGNLVVLYGARTGRDGIGGASVLASQDLDETSEQKRPSVQVGDPFTGKKLIECTLELAEHGLAVSIQDLGAAGLASSTSEMAASGGVGLDLDLTLVPLRETGMEAFEVMVSESQERMAAIVEPARYDAFAAVCARWELPCTAIGTVTDDGVLRCRFDGEVVGEIPAEILTEAPRYALAPERPPQLVDEPVALPAPIEDGSRLLLALLAAPNVCSKRWVSEQYDQLVGSGTVIRPGGDAGVLRLTPSERGLAVALDGDGARVALDPRRGGREAVCQAALNVACTGAEPAAITNCLNFGNPERAHTAYMLREAIAGMSEACEALSTPVVSGNVSLYNEHSGTPIHPTPVVGCVGVLERAALARRSAPEGPTTLWLLGDAVPAHDGSERQTLADGQASGRIPDVDLAAVARLCVRLAGPGIESAHEASDGGLAVALAEICLLAGIGCDVAVDDRAGQGDVMLFGEACGLVVAGGEHVAGAVRIGTLGGERIRIASGACSIDVALDDAGRAYEQTIPAAMAAG